MTEEELSREFSRALEKVYVTTPDVDFDDLAQSYRNVEDSFLRRVAGNEFLTLETKRRVAELMLYSAIDKQCSFELCESLYGKLSRLGFTNLEKKSNVQLIYSRYCLQLGRNDDGILLLEPLEVELEEKRQQSDAPVYRQLLHTVRDVLQQLRATNQRKF